MLKVIRHLASAFIQSTKQRQWNLNSCRHLKHACTLQKTEYVAPQFPCWSCPRLILHCASWAHGLLHFPRSNKLKSPHLSCLVNWHTMCYIIRTFQQPRRILINRIILVIIWQFGKLRNHG